MAGVAAELVRTLDGLLATLPERNREILRLRLAGNHGLKLTQDVVGQQVGLTREHVRQIVQKSLDRLRRAGSLRLRWLLGQMEIRSPAAGQPLSTKLSSVSFPPEAGRYPPAFYLRLLEQLHPQTASSG